MYGRDTLYVAKRQTVKKSKKETDLKKAITNCLKYCLY